MQMLQVSHLLFLIISAPTLLASAVALVPAAGAPGDRWNPLHPGGNKSKCLEVRGGVFANGTPVQINDCNGSAAQQWDISPGNTTIQVHIAEYCLDAGSKPASGVGVKIWKCYDNLPAQSWRYNSNKKITLQQKTSLCLDFPYANGKQVQTKTCYDDSCTQEWTVR